MSSMHGPIEAKTRHRRHRSGNKTVSISDVPKHRATANSVIVFFLIRVCQQLAAHSDIFSYHEASYEASLQLCMCLSTRVSICVGSLSDNMLVDAVLHSIRRASQQSEAAFGELQGLHPDS